MSMHARVLIASLISILTLTGCGGESSGESESSSSQSSNTSSSSPAPSNPSDPIAAAVMRGESAYRETSNGCALCHGLNGENTGFGGPINNLQDCQTCTDLDTLAQKISTTMPTGSPGECSGGNTPNTCAHDVATYMLVRFLNADPNSPAPGNNGGSNNGGNNGGGAGTPLSVALATNTIQVPYDGGVTLTWTTAQAEACNATATPANTQWSGTKGPASGSQAITNLRTNTTFNLQCTKGNESITRNLTVSVTPPGQVTLQIGASPTAINENESALLSWSSTNAQSCSAQANPSNSSWNGAIGLSGSTTIASIAQTTQFSLTCLSLDNLSTTQTVTVTVAPPNQYQPDLARGATLYSQNGCEACHGAQGQGTVLAPSPVDAITKCQPGNCENQDNLTAYLAAEMPKFTPATCVSADRCADDVAAYMLASIFQDANNNGGSGNNGGGTVSTSAFFQGVSAIPYEKTMRRAALLFAGRLPTQSELNVAAGGDEAQIKAAIQNLMQGENFRAFISETVNDHFLTNTYRGRLNEVLDDDDYPVIQSMSNQDKRDAADGLARETQELVYYIASNNRPYTEILSADYIMLNPQALRATGASLVSGAFADNQDDDEFRPARMQKMREGTALGAYPHAGALNSPAWLNRFPSTDSNRNRGRASWAYRFFLGVDIENLAQRTIDVDSTNNEFNPTMTNPACTVCHSVLEPLAGAYQNWGNDMGRWRPREEGGFYTTLARYYARGQARDQNNNPYYQAGDLWYRDMFSVGLNGVPLPTARNDDALRWFASQMIADPRFATGSAKFWYQGVFGQASLEAPVDTTANDYASQLAAFNAQTAMFEQIADNFRSNGHNLKGLLADLVMSPWARAGEVVAPSAQRIAELSSVGMAHILTPEQLNRKMQAVLGTTWRNNRLVSSRDHYLLYGNFDSREFTTRNTQLSSVMDGLVDRMSYETVCEVVRDDFNQQANIRTLFPNVEVNNLPGASDAAIRSNLQHLYARFTGNTLADDDAELDALHTLYADLRTASLLDNINPPCSVSDPDHTQRSWMLMLIYLMGTYEFLYE